MNYRFLKNSKNTSLFSQTYLIRWIIMLFFFCSKLFYCYCFSKVYNYNEFSGKVLYFISNVIIFRSGQKVEIESHFQLNSRHKWIKLIMCILTQKSSCRWKIDWNTLIVFVLETKKMSNGNIVVYVIFLNVVLSIFMLMIV